MKKITLLFAILISFLMIKAQLAPGDDNMIININKGTTAQNTPDPVATITPLTPISMAAINNTAGGTGLVTNDFNALQPIPVTTDFWVQVIYPQNTAIPIVTTIRSNTATYPVVNTNTWLVSADGSTAADPKQITAGHVLQPWILVEYYGYVGGNKIDTNVISTAAYMDYNVWDSLQPWQTTATKNPLGNQGDPDVVEQGSLFSRNWDKVNDFRANSLAQKFEWTPTKANWYDLSQYDEIRINKVRIYSFPATIGAYYFTNNIEDINGVAASNIFPNPSSEESTMMINLKDNCQVSAKISDLTGKIVKNINYGNLSSGENQIQLNVNDLNNGVYFVTLTAGDVQISKRLNVVR